MDRKLYASRFTRARIEEGKNPFTLDSKEASYEYRDFIMNEVLGKLLGKKVPVKEELFTEA